MHAISKEIGLPVSTISSWKKNKIAIYNSKNKRNRYKVICNGKNPQSEKYDLIIAKWVKDKRAERIQINTIDIINKAVELIAEFKDKSMNALYKWCYRFIKRMGFSKRTVGHYSQKISDEIKFYISKFYQMKNQIIKEYMI